jgi:hypothetical protein
MKQFYVTIGITSIVLLSIAMGCSRENKIQKLQLTDYSSLRSEVVKRVQDSQITPDQSGVAALPEELKTASMDGRAYISKGQGHGLLVAFNITRGRSLTTEFLVYSEVPIVDKVKKVTVGPLSLTFESEIDNHWCQMVER